MAEANANEAIAPMEIDKGNGFYNKNKSRMAHGDIEDVNMQERKYSNKCMRVIK